MYGLSLALCSSQEAVVRVLDADGNGLLTLLPSRGRAISSQRGESRREHSTTCRHQNTLNVVRTAT